jgi:TPR repeat protein
MVAQLQIEGVDDRTPPAEGVRRLDALCDDRDGAACLHLGMYLHDGERVPQDRARARDAFERGCTHGHDQCCWDAGVYARDGLGDAQRDAAQARQRFGRACELGHADACREIGRGT